MNLNVGKTVLYKGEEYKVITYTHDFGGTSYLIQRKSDGYKDWVNEFDIIPKED